MHPAAVLVLPRERHTVPAARALLEATLTSLGVAGEDVADLSVALSEACSNAVRHARGAATYRVEIELDPSECSIVVLDEGPGFVPDGQAAMPSPLDEQGRGLALIGALVDGYEVISRPGEGVCIRMHKRLSERGRRAPFPAGIAGYGERDIESRRTSWERRLRR